MKRNSIFLCCILLFLSLTGCGTTSEVAVIELLEPVGVQLDTAVAARGDIYTVAAYQGEVVPYVEEIFFEVDGTLEEINVIYGDEVKEGQILATLDSEALQEEIKSMESAISDTIKLGEYSDRIAEIDIKIAQADYERLSKRGAQRDMELKEIDIEIAEAKLRQEQELRELNLEYQKNNLDQKKKELESKIVRAPFDGTVVFSSQAEKGDQIKGYTTILCVADESRLSIRTDYITEQDVDRAVDVYALIGDQRISVTYVPMDVSEYVKKMLAGTDMQSEFLAQDSSEQLKSGQFAAVMLCKQYVEDTLTIPINALYRDEKGRYVYKIAEDDQIVRCDVTVGAVSDTKAEILEGLQEGETIYVKE